MTIANKTILIEGKGKMDLVHLDSQGENLDQSPEDWKNEKC